MDSRSSKGSVPKNGGFPECSNADIQTDVRQEYGQSPRTNKVLIQYQRRRFRHKKDTRSPTIETAVDVDDNLIKKEKDQLYQNKNHGMKKRGFVFVMDETPLFCAEEVTSSKCAQCSLPFKRIDGKHVQEESDDDDEVEIIDIDAFGKKIDTCPFIPSKTFHQSVTGEGGNEFRGIESKKFRAEVLSILRKPFNNEEYRSYREDIRDGSYVKHNPDFKQVLKKYRYQQKKCLTLLRGFFFWLQNLTRKGAFRPWEDKECLEVEL